MSILIAVLLFGLAFAFIATQNTAVATFNLLGYSWILPTYLIVFGALLIGFFISWIVSVLSTIGTWSSLHGKDSKIRESQQTVTQLQSKIRELELENAKLKGQNEAPRKETVEEKINTNNKPHHFLDRFRRNPAY